jgi:hypothetical protein
MSFKIDDATTKIKKKLSFTDVRTDYKLDNSIIEETSLLFSPLESDSKINDQENNSELINTNMPANCFNDKVVSQFDSNSSKQEENKDCELPVSQLESKKKATYYLTNKAAKQIDEMFTSSILTGKKKDRSTLICEAIEILYQKEFLK